MLEEVSITQKNAPPNEPDLSLKGKGVLISRIFNALIFFFILCLFCVLFLFLPKGNMSEIEKRELAVLPQWSLEAFLSGQYTKALDLYVADNFPDRDEFVQLAHAMGEMRGLRPGEVRIYGATEEETATAPDAASSDVETPQDPSIEQPVDGQPALPPVQESSVSQPENPPKEVGEASQTGGILIYQDRGVSLFGGSTTVSDYYISVLNDYRVELPDINIYSMVVPCSAEFYLPERYEKLSASQKDNIDYIYRGLDPSIIPVDAYGALAEHTDEYIYLRTDHHWTALGAYYAYSAFCRSAQITPVGLSQMQTKRREGFLGTFYSQTRDAKLQANPDVMEYYTLPEDSYQAVMYAKDQPDTPTRLNGIWGEYASMNNSYSIFLHGDWPLVRIDTQNQNGKKIVVVKESYANAFVPFLLHHYENIFVVDERYFQTSLVDLVKENDVTDLLFLNNIFAANTQYHVDNIKRLAHQVWVPPPPPEESSQSEEESSEEE